MFAHNELWYFRSIRAGCNQSQLQQFHLQFNYREKHHCLTYVLSCTWYKNGRNFWIQWWPRLSSESWTALLAKDRPLHWVLPHFDWQRIVFACDELWTFWWRPNEERHWKQADFFSVFCTNCWNVCFSYYVNDQSFIWSYQYHHCNIHMVHLRCFEPLCQSIHNDNLY